MVCPGSKNNYICTGITGFYKITGATYSVAISEQPPAIPTPVGTGAPPIRAPRVRWLKFKESPKQTVDIVRTDILLFNFSGEEHSIVVNTLNPQVDITVSSSPQTNFLLSQANLPKYISIDEDDIVDISFTLENRTTLRAYLTLELFERAELALFQKDKPKQPSVAVPLAIAEQLETEVATKISIWFTLAVFLMLGLMVGWSIMRHYSGKQQYSYKMG